MKELDTITDFVDYLEEEAKFIRSGNLGMAAGEEDLLAYYIKNKHSFVHPENHEWGKEELIIISAGQYNNLIRSPQYINKKIADRNSYLWDEIIKAFTNNIIAGTIILPEGEIFDLSKHEIGVRIMAQEPRLMRRMYSDQILEKLEESSQQNRAFRAMFPNMDGITDNIGYVFMTLVYSKEIYKGGYDQYRKIRSKMLQTYCLEILNRKRNLKKIIGIATEPIPEPGKKIGTSEDMIFIEQPKVWTEQKLEDIKNDCEIFDILINSKIKIDNRSIIEYPNKPE